MTQILFMPQPRGPWVSELRNDYLATSLEDAFAKMDAPMAYPLGGAAGDECVHVIFDRGHVSASAHPFR